LGWRVAENGMGRIGGIGGGHKRSYGRAGDACGMHWVVTSRGENRVEGTSRWTGTETGVKAGTLSEAWGPCTAADESGQSLLQPAVLNGGVDQAAERNVRRCLSLSLCLAYKRTDTGRPPSAILILPIFSGVTRTTRILTPRRFTRTKHLANSSRQLTFPHPFPATLQPYRQTSPSQRAPARVRQRVRRTLLRQTSCPASRWLRGCSAGRSSQ
jgi:hypothetical protein